MSDGQFQKMTLLHQVRLFKFINCKPNYGPASDLHSDFTRVLIMFAKICRIYIVASQYEDIAKD